MREGLQVPPQVPPMQDRRRPISWRTDEQYDVTVVFFNCERLLWIM